MAEHPKSSGNKKRTHLSSQASQSKNTFSQDRFLKARERVNQVLSQAKESLKILEVLEKETLAKARSLIKFPTADERRRLTNDRILSSLKKLGVATQSEVQALELKLQRIESNLPHPRKTQ
jgi:hypothetical protein